MSGGGASARAAVLCAAAICAFLWTAEARAFSPLERNHPRVAEGMSLFEQGKYAEALEQFDQARKELPGNPAVEFNRGNALYKLGRLEEAASAYRQVAEADPGTLRQKDLFNLGNAWAQMGKREEAIAAYRKALELDPSDDQARHNLEVMLARPPPRPQPEDGGTDGGSDGGSGDAGPSDGGGGGSRNSEGNDGGADGGGADAGPNDGGGARQDSTGAGGVDGGTRDAGAEPTPPKQRREGKSSPDGGVPTPSTFRPEEVEQLLDSMKQNEKNLQLWRFQQQKRSKRPHEKDW